MGGQFGAEQCCGCATSFAQDGNIIVPEHNIGIFITTLNINDWNCREEDDDDDDDDVDDDDDGDDDDDDDDDDSLTITIA